MQRCWWLPAHFKTERSTIIVVILISFIILSPTNCRVVSVFQPHVKTPPPQAENDTVVYLNVLMSNNLQRDVVSECAQNPNHRCVYLWFVQEEGSFPDLNIKYFTRTPDCIGLFYREARCVVLSSVDSHLYFTGLWNALGFVWLPLSGWRVGKTRG